MKTEQYTFLHSMWRGHACCVCGGRCTPEAESEEWYEIDENGKEYNNRVACPICVRIKNSLY